MHGSNRSKDLAHRFASALILAVVVLAMGGTSATPVDTSSVSRPVDDRHRADVGRTADGISLGAQRHDLLEADVSIGLPTFAAPSPRTMARFPGRVPSLSDLRAVPTVYDADDQAARTLQSGQTRPTALASGDFDRDGVADLISGYSTTDTGLVTLRLGNIDAIEPDSFEARLSGQQGMHFNEAFLSPVRVIEVPVGPEYLAAGDFNGDDRWDVVVADGTQPALYLLAGDGTGGFAPAVRVGLPGRVTALAAGEINRADGLVDLAIGVDRETGPAVVVFEGPRGALRSDAEILELHAVPTDLALGRFYGGPWHDMAVAAGRDLVLFQGRDRRLALDEKARAAVKPSLVERLEMPEAITAMAWGDFAWEPIETRELALLLQDGTLQLYSPGDAGWQQLGERNISTTAAGNPAAGSTGSALLPVRLSGLPTVDLVVLDGVGGGLQVLSGMVRQDAEPSDDTAQLANAGALVSFETSALPVAVLPMRLNTDASSDLVVLLPGMDEPFVAATAPLATLTVNTAADTTNAGDTFCSLREALINSNTDSDTTSGDCAAGSGVDVIEFNIGGGGSPATIAPLSALPVATDAVTIDGTTQGCAGPPCIVLDGVAAGFVAAGLELAGGSSTVRGLVVQGFLGDPGNSALDAHGILLTSSGNVVEGNHVGVDITGSLARGNDGAGVRIESGIDNTVGGTSAGARNVIASNRQNGVYLPDVGGQGTVILGNYVGTDAGGTVALANGTNFDAIRVGGLNNIVGGSGAGAGNLVAGNTATGMRLTGSGNLVQGNYIGTDVTGAAALANGAAGVAIIDGQNHTVGGTTAGARNVISGNGTGGVFIAGETSENNFVRGNYIGTDLTGTVDLGNIFFGVEVDAASFDATIGGTTAGARNIISGNEMGGVLIEISTQNSVLGNYIGTDVTGTVNLGNTGPGVWVAGSTNNTVGGTTPASRNVISGNGSDGIRMQESSVNEITGNFIGTQVDGISALGNVGQGVALILSSSNNTIGGTGVTPGLCDGPCNRIANSLTPGTDGIRVQVGAGVGNALLGNSIDSNAQLGIDLEDSGVTPNDPQDPDLGANNQQNFPALSAADASPSGLSVSGSLNSTPGTQHRLEFYSSPSCSASGHGEGATYLGFQTVTTDGSGDVSFSAPSLAGVSNGAAITATATSVIAATPRDTSEFSACFDAECSSLAVLGQTVIAQDPSSLTWSVPGNVQYVKGPLADVGSYAVSGTGMLPNATSLDISSDLAGPGAGFYYVVRPLACGSWQTGLGEEPARDLALP